MQTNKGKHFLGIGSIGLMLLAAISAWGLRYDAHQLKEQLKWAAPLILEINFFLILIGIVINWKGLAAEIKVISKKTCVMAFAIALTGVLLAAGVCRNQLQREGVLLNFLINCLARQSNRRRSRWL